uniref:Uncharacterized protein n=1 Tax=Ditylenchus dipsaci TaxID=166011 RepID=A0A915EV26_9BILA
MALTKSISSSISSVRTSWRTEMLQLRGQPSHVSIQLQQNLHFIAIITERFSIPLRAQLRWLVEKESIQ